MSRNLPKINALSLCILAFLFVLVNSTVGKSAESTDQNDPELARLKAVLDCTCECQLTLLHCEEEDADCSVRPALMAKLEKLFNEGKREMELILAFMGPMHSVKEQLMEAKLQNRNAIVYFFQEGCEACEEAEAVLKDASEIWGNEVKISRVDINKKINDQIRQEFRVFSTPTILVIAPNGVVAREFREDITVEKLKNAFVTPVMAQILRGLQDRRVIFLTVQTPDWQNASSITKTVSSVGEVLRSSVRVLELDPTDGEEKPLLEILDVGDNQDQSLTYVVSQTGRIGSRFAGPVSRKDLFLAFQKVLAARSGCGGSGSGPGGNTCK
jgi:thiol-disulfide isomerase/thioredoxin